MADIADEAGVAYGLVYHDFSSKEEILDTLFLERWGLMLDAIAEADRRESSARDKLMAIAAFIIESYRHDPDVMKVIIVEVTRAANTFGRTHLPRFRRPMGRSPRSSAEPSRTKRFPRRDRPRVRGAGLLRADRAGSDDLDLRPRPCGRRAVERAKARIADTICWGLEALSDVGRQPRL